MQSPRHTYPKCPRLGRGMAALVVAMLLMAAPIANAIPPTATEGRPLLPKRSPHSEAVTTALNTVPLQQIEQRTRAQVLDVLSDVTIYQRMPVRTIECDADFYRFLVENPDVIVNIWQELGITRLEFEKRGPGEYKINDNQGTTAMARFAYSSPSLHVIYTDGSYDGALLARPVDGRAVLVLRSKYFREKHGRSFVTCQLEVFMHIERKGIALVAKTLHPLISSMAETNYTQTVAFLGWLHRSALEKPTAVFRLAWHLNRISPEVRGDLEKHLKAITKAVEDAEHADQLAGEAGSQGTMDTGAGSEDGEPAPVAMRVRIVQPDTGETEEFSFPSAQDGLPRSGSLQR